MPNNIVSYGIVGAVLVVVILFALRKVVGGFLAGFWTTLRDKLPKYGAALGSSLFFVLALFILICGLVQYGFPEVWKAWYGHPMFWWTLAALVAVGILLNNKKVNASILVVLLLTVTGTWAIQEAELSRTVVVAPIGTRSPPVKLAVGECIRWWARGLRVPLFFCWSKRN